ncbi:hypothetical protein UFOVP119_60 [uncultured Caudovirales phage]|uniref:Uncharacterized protein n=1 Tax=uncultured Caudovirales phage TaxID=2100421 RepID=A0A6J5LB19_9CAUD|nr:hypothetical protein UFOVP119_60 [uncultured Caudovirales phage]
MKPLTKAEAAKAVAALRRAGWVITKDAKAGTHMGLNKFTARRGSAIVWAWGLKNIPREIARQGEA